MIFKGLAPILHTTDMDRPVRFYIDVLDFTCGMHTPGYSNLFRDNVRIMLTAATTAEKQTAAKFTGQLYIGLERAEDVDAEWERVKDQAEIIYPVDDMHYGAHEFGVRDDTGRHLAFGAPSKNA